MGYLIDLIDVQWAFVERIIPPQEGPGRRRSVNLHLRKSGALVG
jgi:hypothetical protein